ncbi:hypothetical protein F5X99DRAFT_393574 [Biscogniauxia marginata]|nr:hypothetical protein F5X99DRAFT_393574 [Biscogniauxia marginata]
MISLISLLYFYIVGGVVAMVAGLLAVSRVRRRGRERSRLQPQADIDHTEFFGSQVGGKSVISYSYTDLPWKLLVWDIRYFFTFVWALPWIVWPFRPCQGEHFDELSFTRQNMWCLFIHGILIIYQVSFILALPTAFLLPVWLVLIGLAIFFTINWLLCLCLNGKTIVFESDPKYAPALEEHKHEQWIYLNGVACGEAWLQSNINRLALTFKRPVIGIHNRTTGIIFDVVECLIQRNFGYATTDIREAYKVVKEKLYNPQYSKVIFIMHSQGGIEGGLVLDWLLQELPQDLLAKLEVYTFGNAANHFNNPHRHIKAQEAEEKHTLPRVQVPTAITEVPITDSPVDVKVPELPKQLPNGNSSAFKANGHSGTLSSIPEGTSPTAAPLQRQQTFMVPASDRVIGHVEHYAHTTDFVALWGVLHFVTNERATPEMPRFIGRVFSRTSTRGGHQFCQHYLNGMFPLARGENGEFIGCAEHNDFMENVVEAGARGTEKEAIREGFENSLAMIGRKGSKDVNAEVAVYGSFYADRDDIDDGKVRVKNLSRLWQYRNGRSPPGFPMGLEIDEDGVVRGATL